LRVSRSTANGTINVSNVWGGQLTLATGGDEVEEKFTKFSGNHAKNVVYNRQKPIFSSKSV